MKNGKAHIEVQNDEGVPLLARRDKHALYSLYGDDEGQAVAPVKEGPHCCAVCCTFFSAIAIVLLILLGSYLNSGSDFAPIRDGGGTPQQQATQVFIAAGIYGAILVISGYFWFRAS